MQDISIYTLSMTIRSDDPKAIARAARYINQDIDLELKPESLRKIQISPRVELDTG